MKIEYPCRSCREVIALPGPKIVAALFAGEVTVILKYKCPSCGTKQTREYNTQILVDETPNIVFD